MNFEEFRGRSVSAPCLGGLSSQLLSTYFCMAVVVGVCDSNAGHLGAIKQVCVRVLIL